MLLRARKFSLLKSVSLSLSIIMLAQCAFAHLPESNLWQERRARQTTLASSHVSQYAALPAGFTLPASSRVLSGYSQFSPRHLRAAKTPAPVTTGPSSLSSVFEALPAHYGSIRSVQVPSNPNGRVVVHIQDIHSNFEAQANISRTVQNLMRAGAVDAVALEGTWGSLDFSAYRSFPMPLAIQKAADFTLKQNGISGPVHAALMSNGRLPRFIGIDDQFHYRANVNAFKAASALSKSVENHLVKASARIEKQKAKTFGAELLRIDQLVESYHAGRQSLAMYARALSKVQTEAPTSVRMFLDAYNLEESMDLGAVERERASLIRDLSTRLSQKSGKELVEWSLAYRSGRIPHADFYAYLKELCARNNVFLKNFPALDQYVRYVLLAGQIDGEKLFAEIGRLEAAALDKLARSPKEKELLARARNLRLERKLADFSLTKDEWDQYKSVIPAKAGTQASNLSQKNVYELDSRFRGNDDFIPFEKFYFEAEARDAAMAANLSKASKGAVALVTGGFHSKGVARRLLEDGTTVVTFVPKITKVEGVEGGMAALGIFNQEKTPLEKLFSGERLFLANNPTAEMTGPFGSRAVASAKHMGAPQSAEDLLRRLPKDNGPKSKFRASGNAPSSSRFNLTISASNGAVETAYQFDQNGNIVSETSRVVGVLTRIMPELVLGAVLFVAGVSVPAAPLAFIAFFLTGSVVFRFAWLTALFAHGLGHAVVKWGVDKNHPFSWLEASEGTTLVEFLAGLIPLGPIFTPGLSPNKTLDAGDQGRAKMMAKASSGVLFNLAGAGLILAGLTYLEPFIALNASVVLALKVLAAANLLAAGVGAYGDGAAFIYGRALVLGCGIFRILFPFTDKFQLRHFFHVFSPYSRVTREELQQVYEEMVKERLGPQAEDSQDSLFSRIISWVFKKISPTYAARRQVLRKPVQETDEDRLKREEAAKKSRELLRRRFDFFLEEKKIDLVDDREQLFDRIETIIDAAAGIRDPKLKKALLAERFEADLMVLSEWLAGFGSHGAGVALQVIEPKTGFRKFIKVKLTPGQDQFPLTYMRSARTALVQDLITAFKVAVNYAEQQGYILGERIHLEGHFRLKTSGGILEEATTQPFFVGAGQMVRFWSVVNGKAVVKVMPYEAYGAANGDYNEGAIPGQPNGLRASEGEWGAFAQEMYGVPVGANDSEKAVWYEYIVRRKGDLKGSFRLGDLAIFRQIAAVDVEQADGSVTKVNKLPAKVGLPTDAQLAQLEKLVEPLVEKYLPRIERNDAASAAARAEFIKQATAKVATHPLMSARSAIDVKRFTEYSLNAFLDNDAYKAAKIMMGHVDDESTYGMFFDSSVEKDKTVFISSLQPVTFLRDADTGLIFTASSLAYSMMALLSDPSYKPGHRIEYFFMNMKKGLNGKGGEIVEFDNSEHTMRVYDINQEKDLSEEEIEARWVDATEDIERMKSYMVPTLVDDPVHNEVLASPGIGQRIHNEWRNESISLPRRDATDQLSKSFLKSAETDNAIAEAAREKGIQVAAGNKAKDFVLLTFREENLAIANYIKDLVEGAFPLAGVKVVNASRHIHDLDELLIDDNTNVLIIDNYINFSNTRAAEDLERRAIYHESKSAEDIAKEEAELDEALKNVEYKATWKMLARLRDRRPGNVFVMTPLRTTNISMAFDEKRRNVIDTTHFSQVDGSVGMAWSQVISSLELYIRLLKNVRAATPTGAPFGLQLTMKDIENLDQAYTRMVTREATETVRDGSERHKQLENMAARMEPYFSEQARAFIWTMIHLLVSVPIGVTVVSFIFTPLLYAGGPSTSVVAIAIKLGVGALNALFYAFFGYLVVRVIRGKEGREAFHRNSTPAIVFGDDQWASLLQVIAAKEFAMAKAIVSPPAIYDAEQSYRLEGKYGHMARRGTVIQIRPTARMAASVSKEIDKDTKKKKRVVVESDKSKRGVAAARFTKRQAESFASFGEGPLVVGAVNLKDPSPFAFKFMADTYDEETQLFQEEMFNVDNPNSFDNPVEAGKLLDLVANAPIRLLEQLVVMESVTRRLSNKHLDPNVPLLYRLVWRVFKFYWHRQDTQNSLAATTQIVPPPATWWTAGVRRVVNAVQSLMRESPDAFIAIEEEDPVAVAMPVVDTDDSGVFAESGAVGAGPAPRRSLFGGVKRKVLGVLVALFLSASSIFASGGGPLPYVDPVAVTQKMDLGSKQGPIEKAEADVAAAKARLGKAETALSEFESEKAVENYFRSNMDGGPWLDWASGYLKDVKGAGAGSGVLVGGSATIELTAKNAGKVESSPQHTIVIDGHAYQRLILKTDGKTYLVTPGADFKKIYVASFVGGNAAWKAQRARLAQQVTQESESVKTALTALQQAKGSKATAEAFLEKVKSTDFSGVQKSFAKGAYAARQGVSGARSGFDELGKKTGELLSEIEKKSKEEQRKLEERQNIAAAAAAVAEASLNAALNTPPAPPPAPQIAPAPRPVEDKVAVPVKAAEQDVAAGQTEIVVADDARPEQKAAPAADLKRAKLLLFLGILSMFAAGTYVFFRGLIRLNALKKSDSPARRDSDAEVDFKNPDSLPEFRAETEAAIAAEARASEEGEAGLEAIPMALIVPEEETRAPATKLESERIEKPVAVIDLTPGDDEAEISFGAFHSRAGNTDVDFGDETMVDPLRRGFDVEVWTGHFKGFLYETVYKNVRDSEFNNYYALFEFISDTLTSADVLKTGVNPDETVMPLFYVVRSELDHLRKKNVSTLGGTERHEINVLVGLLDALLGHSELRPIFPAGLPAVFSELERRLIDKESEGRFNITWEIFSRAVVPAQITARHLTALPIEGEVELAEDAGVLHVKFLHKGIRLLTEEGDAENLPLGETLELDRDPGNPSLFRAINGEHGDSIEVFNATVQGDRVFIAPGPGLRFATESGSVYTDLAMSLAPMPFEAPLFAPEPVLEYAEEIVEEPVPTVDETEIDAAPAPEPAVREWRVGLWVSEKAKGVRDFTLRWTMRFARLALVIAVIGVVGLVGWRFAPNVKFWMETAGSFVLVFVVGLFLGPVVRWIFMSRSYKQAALKLIVLVTFGVGTLVYMWPKVGPSPKPVIDKTIELFKNVPSKWGPDEKAEPAVPAAVPVVDVKPAAPGGREALEDRLTLTFTDAKNLRPQLYSKEARANAIILTSPDKGNLVFDKTVPKSVWQNTGRGIQLSGPQEIASLSRRMLEADAEAKKVAAETAEKNFDANSRVGNFFVDYRRWRLDPDKWVNVEPREIMQLLSYQDVLKKMTEAFDSNHRVNTSGVIRAPLAAGDEAVAVPDPSRKSGTVDMGDELTLIYPKKQVTLQVEVSLADFRDYDLTGGEVVAYLDFKGKPRKVRPIAAPVLIDNEKAVIIYTFESSHVIFDWNDATNEPISATKLQLSAPKRDVLENSYTDRWSSSPTKGERGVVAPYITVPVGGGKELEGRIHFTKSNLSWVGVGRSFAEIAPADMKYFESIAGPIQVFSKQGEAIEARMQGAERMYGPQSVNQYLNRMQAVQSLKELKKFPLRGNDTTYTASTTGLLVRTQTLEGQVPVDKGPRAQLIVMEFLYETALDADLPIKKGQKIVLRRSWDGKEIIGTVYETKPRKVNDGAGEDKGAKQDVTIKFSQLPGKNMIVPGEELEPYYWADEQIQKQLERESWALDLFQSVLMHPWNLVNVAPMVPSEMNIPGDMRHRRLVLESLRTASREKKAAPQRAAAADTKGVADPVLKSILQSTYEQSWTDLHNLLQKGRLSQSQIETLALAGRADITQKIIDYLIARPERVKDLLRLHAKLHAQSPNEPNDMARYALRGLLEQIEKGKTSEKTQDPLEILVLATGKDRELVEQFFIAVLGIPDASMNLRTAQAAQAIIESPMWNTNGRLARQIVLLERTPKDNPNYAANLRAAARLRVELFLGSADMRRVWGSAQAHGLHDDTLMYQNNAIWRELKAIHTTDAEDAERRVSSIERLVAHNPVEYFEGRIVKERYNKGLENYNQFLENAKDVTGETPSSLTLSLKAPSVDYVLKVLEKGGRRAYVENAYAQKDWYKLARLVELDVDREITDLALEYLLKDSTPGDRMLIAREMALASGNRLTRELIKAEVEFDTLVVRDIIQDKNNQAGSQPVIQAALARIAGSYPSGAENDAKRLMALRASFYRLTPIELNNIAEGREHPVAGLLAANNVPADAIQKGAKQMLDRRKIMIAVNEIFESDQTYWRQRFMSEEPLLRDVLNSLQLQGFDPAETERALKALAATVPPALQESFFTKLRKNLDHQQHRVDKGLETEIPTDSQLHWVESTTLWWIALGIVGVMVGIAGFWGWLFRRLGLRRTVAGAVLAGAFFLFQAGASASDGAPAPAQSAPALKTQIAPFSSPAGQLLPPVQTFALGQLANNVNALIDPEVPNEKSLHIWELTDSAVAENVEAALRHVASEPRLASRVGFVLLGMTPEMQAKAAELKADYPKLGVSVLTPGAALDELSGQINIARVLGHAFVDETAPALRAIIEDLANNQARLAVFATERNWLSAGAVALSDDLTIDLKRLEESKRIAVFLIDMMNQGSVKKFETLESLVTTLTVTGQNA